MNKYFNPFFTSTKVTMLRWKDFRGRSSRLDFCWGMVALIVLFFFSQFFNFFFLKFLKHYFVLKDLEGGAWLLFNLYAILAILILPWFLIISLITLLIRRMHDVNRSGFWLLLVPVVPFTVKVLRLLFSIGDEEKNEYGDSVESIQVHKN